MDRALVFPARSTRPHGETDITFGFGPNVLGSIPSEGTAWQAGEPVMGVQFSLGAQIRF